MSYIQLTLFFLFLLSYALAQDCIHCGRKSTRHADDIEKSDIFKTARDFKNYNELKNCKQINTYSCLYLNSDLKHMDDVLIIYHRGYWGKHQGNVPQSLRKKSIAQALSFYDLGKTSEELKSPMLISTSSHVGFTVKEIAAAIKKIKLRSKTKVILAAHSGGYQGLLKTLKYLKKEKYQFTIDRIVMLDNFYFNQRAGSILKDYIANGAKCSGFLTQHNLKRYKARFKSVIMPDICSIELRREHNKSVNDCLAAYVKGNQCN